MDRVAPDALLLNYVNPMAANCWAVDAATARPPIGLCHSVQDTSEMLAEWVGVPYEEVAYLCAGINHQAFFLRFSRDGEDLYPAIKEAAQREDAKSREPVRIELMEHFGYFVTESSGHASEYVPYFRKNAKLIERFIPRRWDYYQICLHHDEGSRTGELLARLKAELAPSVEYGAQIMYGMQTRRAQVIYGNVPNRGLIPNLPEGCCVEVPCLVDGNGVQPTAVGPLPPQCAALNRTNVNVQELAVEAALSGERAHVYQAIMLDPLTGAILTLEQIRAMVDELFAAEAEWLPQFTEA
jgi:alpha-galactosidase